MFTNDLSSHARQSSQAGRLSCRRKTLGIGDHRQHYLSRLIRIDLLMTAQSKHHDFHRLFRCQRTFDGAVDDFQKSLPGFRGVVCKKSAGDALQKLAIGHGGNRRSGGCTRHSTRAHSRHAARPHARKATWQHSRAGTTRGSSETGVQCCSAAQSCLRATRSLTSRDTGIEQACRAARRSQPSLHRTSRRTGLPGSCVFDEHERK